jgi:hypothetical protein
MSVSNLFGRAVLVAGLFLVTASVMLSRVAEAGCLSEQRSCRACASRMLKRAMFRFDAWGILDANVALWDCAVPLRHLRATP